MTKKTISLTVANKTDFTLVIPNFTEYTPPNSPMPAPQTTNNPEENKQDKQL